MTEKMREEKKVMDKLKELEKDWPKHLMIFANGSSLSVLRLPQKDTLPECDVIGEVEIPNDGGAGV